MTQERLSHKIYFTKDEVEKIVDEKITHDEFMAFIKNYKKWAEQEVSVRQAIEDDIKMCYYSRGLI
jgi:hypothetical protein